ncbi:MAG TPA: AAA domain-containing protein [Planctomycetaceae bacterium]|nr:AAA domain-containing protein [Planctomycetaceae bacterium]
MTSQRTAVETPPFDRLQGDLVPVVRYLYDCLAAQTDWARAVNVLGQKDLELLPLSREQQERLGREGRLELFGPEALELGNRWALAGADASLALGALFLVGHSPARGDRAERRYCAPLLEVPLALTRELAAGRVVIEPQEEVFSVNYCLVGELLAADEEDLADRLADLAGIVPDFPIDPGEFRAFWNGFRIVAADLPVCEELPRPRRGQSAPQVSPGTPGSSPAPAEGNDDAEPVPGAPASVEPCWRGGLPGSIDAVEPLELVDFYLPRIPKDGQFRLLPASAVILGRRTAHVLSALGELHEMTRQPLEHTAFASVFAPPGVRAGGDGGGSAADGPRAGGEARGELAQVRQPAPLLSLPPDAFPLPLTAAQQAVVESARTAPLTVVTGPPGTGKSYTITAIVLDALLRGESVLVASQMDKAVEVVARHVETVAGPFALARSGGREVQRELASRIARLTGPTRSHPRYGAQSTEVPDAAGLDELARRHAELTRELATLEDRYLQTVEQETRWSACRESYERLAPVCPLPVHEIPSYRFGRAERAARWALAALADEAGWLRRCWGTWHKRRALRLLKVPGHWSVTPGELRECVRVHGLYQTMQAIEQTLRVPFPADLLWQEIARVEHDRTAASLELLRLTRELVLTRLTRDEVSRGDLRHFRTLLRRRNPKLKRELREKIDCATLLRAFPAWASTTRALGQILPLLPGMFDLVVIDEASQCELATAAVALARGRRAVVVGDPQQLRHVSFLSRAREQASFVRHGLGAEVQEKLRYRRSLFDVASDAVRQEQFFLLDQHFRSDPHIIAFSNRHFYDGELRIMTERPRREPSSAIRVVQAAGRRQEGGSVNTAEIEAVAAEVAAIVAAAQGGERAPSVGVVCPFRDQVDAIRERLVRDVPAAIARHELVVGTAHSFQGDEKDVIILSTSIDRHAHSGSLTFLQNPNLFNVAVTRARRQLVVVTSVEIADLPEGLLRDYLHHSRGTLQPHAAGGRYASDYQQGVAEELRRQQVDVWPGFGSAGVRIDVAAAREQTHLALFCDGPPRSPDDSLDPLTAHRLLIRAGWGVRRIPRRSWLADWYGCFEYVREGLGGRSGTR